jgi:hypothetical protein
MVRYGRRKIGRSFFHTRYFVLDNNLLAYYKKQPKGNMVRDSYFCELGILLLGWLVLWSICSPFLCSKICLRLYYKLLSLTVEVVLLSAIRAHVRSMTPTQAAQPLQFPSLDF